MTPLDTIAREAAEKISFDVYDGNKDKCADSFAIIILTALETAVGERDERIDWLALQRQVECEQKEHALADSDKYFKQLTDLRAQLSLAIEITQKVVKERDGLLQELDAANAVGAEMRSALKDSQWSDNMSCPFCRVCGRSYLEKHLDDCQIGKALSTTCGTEILAERDKLKAELEQARKDGEHLDWIETFGTVEVEIDGRWKAVDHVTGRIGKGVTVRAAIANARQAEKEGKV